MIKPDSFISKVHLHSKRHTWAVVVRWWARQSRIPELIRNFLSFRLWEAERFEQVFGYRWSPGTIRLLFYQRCEYAMEYAGLRILLELESKCTS